MRLSIIIPVYNAEKTLRRCLDSILSQDDGNYEVICINDGSNDSSLEILEEYALQDKRIRVVNQTNSGPSMARNTGLDNAQGEWILFVDADDYLCVQSALTTLCKTIHDYPDCELIYYAGEVMVSEGKYHDMLQPRRYDYGYQCMEENCNLSKCIVFGALYAQCYRRSVIEKYNLRFDADIVYGEDRLFVCTYFLKAGETIVISDVLYTYVVMMNSLMRDEKKKRRQFHDNRAVAMLLEKEIVISGENVPYLRKYIHGLYVQSVKDLPWNKISWAFIFRNATTWKLKIKDLLMFLGLYHY